MMESGISRLKNSLVGVTKNVAALGLSFYLRNYGDQKNVNFIILINLPNNVLNYKEQAQLKKKIVVS